MESSQWETISFDLNFIINRHSLNFDRIGGVMIGVLASSAVYRGFEPWSGQTKE
jgi:hypothetical protein